MWIVGVVCVKLRYAEFNVLMLYVSFLMFIFSGREYKKLRFILFKFVVGLEVYVYEEKMLYFLANLFYIIRLV